MKLLKLLPLCSLLLAGLCFPLREQAQTGTNNDPSVAELQRLFQTPPDDARIMMRWWWYGPAISQPQLERELRLMKEGGIGGFEVQPVYPLQLDDETKGIKTVPFLSDGHLDALRFTAAKARELGLRFDLTLGSGWPFGGPTVPVQQAASRLRVERVKVESGQRRIKLPASGAGEAFIAAFLARTQGDTVAPDSLRELGEIREGGVWLPADLAGTHEVMFFIASRTGQQVKRAAVGSEGFVLDHYSRTATENYLKQVGDRLMQAFDGQPPHAVFCDSLEVYSADWTDDLLAEFRRRRSYDLKPHLPALVVDVGGDTTKIRRDWGLTLTELLNERFLAPLRDWSKHHRTLFRLQGYGTPPAALSSNAYADLIEGEGWQWKILRYSRWAASANHLYGRAVTSSEAWTWLHSPAFRATPLDLKAEADRHFLQGINQLIGHGWAHTPESVEYPGWRFYAAGIYNEKNPWWHVMPDVSKYLQRVSYLLRQGQPANDVAIYLPTDDAYAHFTAGNVHLVEVLRERLGPDVIPQVLEAGYNFDFFDDEALRQAGRVEPGVLVFNQSKYKIVLLPYVGRIPPDTYQKLAEFARGGGIVIATRRTPLVAPGKQATQGDTDKILELSRRLFKDAAAPGHFVEDEKAQLAAKLNNVLRPDVAFAPAAPDIGFVHRSTAEAEVYFLANTANLRQRVNATFRVAGSQVEWWNPMDGSVAPAEVVARLAGGTTVALDLEPYGSRILVFTKRALPRTTQTRLASLPPAIDLNTGWRVTFGQGNQAMPMDKLRSWTEDEQTRYFSGLATYEKTVAVPDSLIKSGGRVLLDFGEVVPVEVLPYQPPRAGGMHAGLEAPIREAAVVYLNDQLAGSVWCPPYALDVTGLLRRGENKLRIVVGNTAINYLAGRSLPDYRLLNLRYGERFVAQDMDKVQPVTSGLLGPIRLRASAK
jgi:hypothetical protein